MTSVAHGIAHEIVGKPLSDASLLIVWAHGWGQNRDAFRGLASAFHNAASVLLDFPGFGASPPPATEWGTAEYADAAAGLIREIRDGKKVLWVGHSFGCRVGIQLAARHPELVDSMCLIAAAGLQRRRSLLQRLRMRARVTLFKIMKRLPQFIIGDPDRLRERFGSSDYRNAGALRGVFLRVIREDLSAVASRVACPCLLVYGENDGETPPEIGARLAALMQRARLCVLPGLDHYSVLGSGRHIVAKRMTEFMSPQ